MDKRKQGLSTLILLETIIVQMTKFFTYKIELQYDGINNYPAIPALERVTRKSRTYSGLRVHIHILINPFLYTTLCVLIRYLQGY